MFSLILAIMHYYISVQDQINLLREPLLFHHQSPLHHLMDQGDLSSFLLMTGLAWAALNRLNNIISLCGHSPQRTKKPMTELPPDTQLGLLGSIMSFKHLCLLFGIKPSGFSAFFAMCSNSWSSDWIVIWLQMFEKPRVRRFFECRK